MPLTHHRPRRSTPVPWLARAWRAGLRLARITLAVITRYRLTGLAGEAAFFTLTSLPPLLFGLVAALGSLASGLGLHTLGAVRTTLEHLVGAVLSPQGIDQLLEPVLNEVLSTDQAGVVSLGFLLTLWSGSTALHVFVDAIALVYEVAEQRSLLRQRLLALGLYTLGLLSGLVLLPLLALGPNWLAHLLPAATTLIHLLYWPGVALGSLAALTTLYTLAVPLRTPWREHLPGAALALAVWLLGSAALRGYLTILLAHSPVYGVLAAPIGLLLWLYLTALAVLLGAALNSQLDRIMPRRSTAQNRAALTTPAA